MNLVRYTQRHILILSVVLALAVCVLFAALQASVRAHATLPAAGVLDQPGGLSDALPSIEARRIISPTIGLAWAPVNVL